jgi:hypothetical protein
MIIINLYLDLSSFDLFHKNIKFNFHIGRFYKKKKYIYWEQCGF